MALKIKASYNQNQIAKQVEAAVKAYIDNVIAIYSRAGKAMVEDARRRKKDFSAYGNGSFGNITFNLRSSIGCVVYLDGMPKFSYFPVLSTGAEGARRGRAYADEVTMGMDGIVLVVVAGMDYARAVENRGYNVITATSLIAEKIMDKYIKNAA